MDFSLFNPHACSLPSEQCVSYQRPKTKDFQADLGSHSAFIRSVSELLSAAWSRGNANWVFTEMFLTLSHSHH